VRRGVPLDLDRDLTTRIAVGSEANLPRLGELLGGKNSFSARKRRLGELEEFGAEISRDSDLGNRIPLVLIRPGSRDASPSHVV
jgi:hypothetical protein